MHWKWKGFSFIIFYHWYIFWIHNKYIYLEELVSIRITSVSFLFPLPHPTVSSLSPDSNSQLHKPTFPPPTYYHLDVKCPPPASCVWKVLDSSAAEFSSQICCEEVEPPWRQVPGTVTCKSVLLSLAPFSSLCSLAAMDLVPFPPPCSSVILFLS